MLLHVDIYYWCKRYIVHKGHARSSTKSIACSMKYWTIASDKNRLQPDLLWTADNFGRLLAQKVARHTKMVTYKFNCLHKFDWGHFQHHQIFLILDWKYVVTMNWFSFISMRGRCRSKLCSPANQRILHWSHCWTFNRKQPQYQNVVTAAIAICNTNPTQFDIANDGMELALVQRGNTYCSSNYTIMVSSMAPLQTNHSCPTRTVDFRLSNHKMLPSIAKNGSQLSLE